MIKRLINNIKFLFIYLFFGLKNADKILTGPKSDVSGDGNVIERQDEENTVYNDLLRGEVTQEVRELRHEMYYSERASHKYKYIGNGLVVKKNDLFEYQGKIDRSDGFPVQLIQQNTEDTGTLSDNLRETDYRLKNKEEYTISIKRDFLPRFKLEKYTTKLVVKRINDTAVMLDFYTPIYKSQFSNIHRPFLNEIDRIYQGNVKSDVIDFDEVEFITFKAFGADDLKKYTYNNVEFDNILIYEGDYVLKFTADIVNDGEDLIEEFYCKEEDEKSKNHEARKNKTKVYDFMEVAAKQNDTYDYDEAERLIENIEEK